MFYNKKINIYAYTGYEDEHGIDREGYKKIEFEEPIIVDIQPLSGDKVEKTYGYNLDVTKQMFCDYNDYILEDSIIEYKNKFYKIIKIIEWDDYLQIALSEIKNINIIETEVGYNE